MRAILMLALSIWSISCATKYQPMSFTGGYSDQQLNKELYEVTFSGNGYTSASTVHDYFLRRCAEITLINRYDYFLLVDKNANTDITYSASTTGYYSPNYYGGYNYNSQTQINRISKHSESGVIKLFKNGQQPEYSYDARNFAEDPYIQLDNQITSQEGSSLGLK